MEAKQLRLGNYYIDIDDKLTELSGYELYQMTIKENTDILGETEFRPIPLTEDWLLKFGADNSLYMRYLDFGYFDIYKLNDVWYVEKEGVTLCELKYVHQLQNLYFALTREELTIKQ